MEVQKATEELSELSLNPNNKKAELAIEEKGEKKSLQEAFERFRKRKVETLKTVEKPIVPKERNAEFKSYLRAKFVETAKKYIGTPYGKRFLTPDHPNYNAKLFLDCCALVRQAVEDLKHEFGFMIPRLNQSYQYDTLPISIKFDEMKPGDLIFYQGTYLNPKLCKRQAHDLVHVEIFLGGGPTGEETLASRWNNGCVSLFPSYKFKSTLYTDVKHTYKSIDTWLDGILMNHCKEHHWVDKPLLLRPDKKSIFSNGNDAENVENCGLNPEDCDEDNEMPGEPAPLDSN